METLGQETLPIGHKAPDFACKTTTGEHVSLSCFLGKTTVFLCFTSYFYPWNTLLPYYVNLRVKLSEQDIQIVFVSLDSQERTLKFLDDLDLQIPVLLAQVENNSFAADYRFSDWPAYYLLDAHGVVQLPSSRINALTEWKALLSMWEQRL